MKFTKKDLLESLKLKIGDRILVHSKYSPWVYLTVREDLMLEFDNGNTDSLISLVGSEFEKVINFKLMSFRYAMQGIENGDDIYIKYKGKYLLCNTYSNSSDFGRRVKIVFKENDILTHTIGLFESAYCEFYKKEV
jgi:hypothetical protein